MPNVEMTAFQLYEKGRRFRVEGDYELAVACLQQASAADPNDPHIHLELGLAYCFSGLFDESIHELEVAHALDQTDVEICLHLAKTYTMLGFFDEGTAMFRLVMTLTPPDDKYYQEAQKQLAYFT